MAEVAITLNSRIYRLSCSDGEESRLHALSQVVEGKLSKLVAEFGQVGDDRLLLLSALQIADDLLDAQAKAAALEEAVAALRPSRPVAVD